MMYVCGLDHAELGEQLFVLTTCTKLIEVQSKENLKVKKWKMKKSNHEWIIEDGIPLRYFKQQIHFLKNTINICMIPFWLVYFRVTLFMQI